jgi:hypothetical protein
MQVKNFLTNTTSSLWAAPMPISSFAAAALGVDTYKHAQGGWKVTKDSIDKLIQAAEEEDTAAGSKSGSLAGYDVPCRIYIPSLQYWFTAALHFVYFFQIF